MMVPFMRWTPVRWRFKIAGSMALVSACQKADLVLLGASHES